MLVFSLLWRVRWSHLSRFWIGEVTVGHFGIDDRNSLGQRLILIPTYQFGSSLSCSPVDWSALTKSELDWRLTDGLESLFRIGFRRTKSQPYFDGSRWREKPWAWMWRQLKRFKWEVYEFLWGIIFFCGGKIYCPVEFNKVGTGLTTDSDRRCGVSVPDRVPTNKVTASWCCTISNTLCRYTFFCFYP